MNFNIKQRRIVRTRGVAMIEVTLSLTFLVTLALLTLKASINVVEAQRWTVIQSLTDAYLTREAAIANRVPFGDLQSGTSDWPVYPASQTQQVEIGKLPRGIPVSATLVRTRYASQMNTATNNPTQMEAWVVKSYLRYQLGNQEYVKSRTTVRVR